MDIWLYYEVTHANHTFCNPVSDRGIRDLEHFLDLGPGVRVLDIASGHGEMLIRFADRYEITGVGVDASPYAHRRAEERRAARVPEADLTFVHGRGEEYRPPKRRAFDVAMCIGASWIWSGFEGTLRALMGFVRPGGLVVSGEPYLLTDPSPEYCEIGEFEPDTFFDLPGCADVAKGLGLETVWMRRSTAEEWDRYEMDQMAALDRWVRDNPDHPDREEIQRRKRADAEAYYRWGHRELGFATWVFRTPE
jgi:SAM-dependent methyltransferase